MAENTFVTPIRTGQNVLRPMQSVKSVQQSDFMMKKKNALGDIKNQMPITPVNNGTDKSNKKLSNETPWDRNLVKSNGDDDLFETASSQPADYEEFWAQRLQLNDDEINRLVAAVFEKTGDIDHLPPPPPPEYEEDVYHEMLLPEIPDLYPPPHLDDTDFSMMSDASDLDTSVSNGLKMLF